MEQPPAARDKVVATIRAAIIGGELVPGEHLVEQVIAERLGVSRNPVREALSVLHKLGLVNYIRNRGMFVVAMDVAQQREIYLIRGLLEGQACALAARHARPEEIDALRRVNTAMAGSVADHEAFVAANMEFHRIIHRMSRSPVLAEMIEDLWDRCRNFRHAGFFAEAATERSVRDHELILYAIGTSDPALAQLLGTRSVHRRWPGLLDAEADAPARATAAAAP